MLDLVHAPTRKWVSLGTALLLLACLFSDVPAGAASCGSYAGGISWGTVSINALTEASGLAASARNPGVLWAHNDGSRQNIYAIATNGALLATFNLGNQVEDVEDIAVGPGPAPGQFYLYLGDIGGNAEPDGLRGEVEILRIPEPFVSLDWEDDPVIEDFGGVDSFFFTYPDGRYDAETLLVDPVGGDVWIATKQSSLARLYRASLSGLNDGDHAVWSFARSVFFASAAGGDISASGEQILLRREDAAVLWSRAGAESISDALGRAGTTVPVIGTPVEPNGEAITFLRDDTGYVTLSEGEDPPLYFFQALCPRAPILTLVPTNRTVFVGESLTLDTAAIGYPPPVYQWRRDGDLLPDRTNATLQIPSVTTADAGVYEVTAANAHGTAVSSAELIVRLMPDLRITEVQSAPADQSAVPTADWWELTNFETRPINLSGWRFNDNEGGLDDPFVVPAGSVIQPGQSMVFVEELSPTAFRQWWGAANVPVSVPIITYAGSGLGLSANGDGIRLWNEVVTDPSRLAAAVDFGDATSGVTFNYDPRTGQLGTLSRLGTDGVIRAATTLDVGSPGRILGPVVAPVLTASLSPSGEVEIGFAAEAGRLYHLESRASLTAGAWLTSASALFPTNRVGVQFVVDLAAPGRYFRVRVEGAANNTP